MTTVSVITICLNAAKTIEQTIKSVRGQTYSHIEHVIIDGGSNDGTLAIIDRYRDSVDYIVSERDHGLYHAMNKGIRAATGDILFFLNADDRFVDGEVVTDVVAAFREDNALEIVYGDVLWDIEGKLRRWVQPDQFSRRSLAGRTVCHQAVFARRKLLEGDNGFNEEFRVVSDLDWLIRMAEQEVRLRHIDRDIAVLGIEGRSNNTQWEFERRRMMQRYYSNREIFLWRTVPRTFNQKIHQALRRVASIMLGKKLD